MSEFEEAGLTPVDSDLVKAPRIAEAPVAMECQFRHLITNGREHLTNVIIGEVVRWHVREDVMIEEGKYIDPVLLRPVGRLAGQRILPLARRVRHAAARQEGDAVQPQGLSRHYAKILLSEGGE